MLKETATLKTRIAFAALAFVCTVPLAHAQIVIQTPQLPGVRVDPDRRDPRAESEREAYWRQRHENERAV
jgi:hypothetical protein